MKKTIWVVDDDPIYQIIMKKIIQKSGLFSSSFLFSNGKEAIDALKENATKNENLPDIILLDIEMPMLDGWCFMEEYIILSSQISSSIKIYISSSSIAIDDKERVKNNPAILGYFSKPITTTILAEIASK